MTSLTVVTVLVIVFGALNSQGYGRALALGGTTAAGAALAVGGIAVPTFYAVALGAVIILAVGLLGYGPRNNPRRRQSLPPGAPLLLLFLAWCAVVTVLSPVLFSGTAVVLPKGPGQLVSGQLTPSNVAQLGYLVIGTCVVVYLARSPHTRPQLLAVTVCTTVILSFWRFLNGEIGLPFPEDFFDNSPTLAFIETAPGGAERFRGILSEPSSLGASCLVGLSYCFSRATQVTGLRRVGLLVVAGLAVYMGSISTSGGFVVATVVVASIAGVSLGVGFLLRRYAISTVTGVAVCAFFVAAMWILPQVTAFVEATVNDKVGSESFAERSGADASSYNVFFDTWGVGAGLGANRASSFLPGLLSTTGLIGTLLLTLAIAGLIGRTFSIRECRPVIWALVSLLVLKITAGPDLSDPSGVLWVSLGVLSNALLWRREGVLRTDTPVHDEVQQTLRPPSVGWAQTS